MITLYGFDNAIVGTASACCADGYVHRAIYDGSKIVEILMDSSRMSREEAEEYISYNIIGLCIGDDAPLVMWPKPDDTLVIEFIEELSNAK